MIQWIRSNDLKNHQVCDVVNSRIQAIRTVHHSQRNVIVLKTPHRNGLASNALARPN